MPRMKGTFWCSESHDAQDMAVVHAQMWNVPQRLMWWHLVVLVLVVWFLWFYFGKPRALRRRGLCWGGKSRKMVSSPFLTLCFLSAISCSTLSTLHDELKPLRPWGKWIFPPLKFMSDSCHHWELHAGVKGTVRKQVREQFSSLATVVHLAESASLLPQNPLSVHPESTCPHLPSQDLTRCWVNQILDTWLLAESQLTFLCQNVLYSPNLLCCLCPAPTWGPARCLGSTAHHPILLLCFSDKNNYKLHRQHINVQITRQARSLLSPIWSGSPGLHVHCCCDTINNRYCLKVSSIKEKKMSF